MKKIMTLLIMMFVLVGCSSSANFKTDQISVKYDETIFTATPADQLTEYGQLFYMKSNNEDGELIVAKVNREEAFGDQQDMDFDTLASAFITYLLQGDSVTPEKAKFKGMNSFQVRNDSYAVIIAEDSNYIYLVLGFAAPESDANVLNGINSAIDSIKFK